MKGNIEGAAVRVHDLIPHEHELSTIWDTLIKAFECGYARGTPCHAGRKVQGKGAEGMKDTRKRRPGRPMKPEGERLKSYGIRLSGPDIERLDRYCRRNGTTRSRAIRNLVKLLGR